MSINEKQNSLQLPILDISKPLVPSTLSSLSQACKEWGFFHIKNHGISKELYNKLYMLSNNAFNVPLDVKLKLGPSSSSGTYTPHFIASPFFESLRVSGPDYFTSAKTSTDVLFEAPNTEFCEAFNEYGSKMTYLSKTITSILLNSLGHNFEQKYCESEFKNCSGYLRINNYSSTNTTKPNQEIEGLGMHTDMSCITILAQDQTGGLQVRSISGRWMDIAPNEGTLVVNIGDLLQAWSNGRFRSSAHRVVLKQGVGNRFSLAFFWCFEDDKVIAAPDDVVDGDGERIYQDFLCRDYMKFRENSERGRFEKVGFTIDDFAVNSSSKKVDSRRTVSL